MHFVHLKTSGFLRVLLTRDRIVRSNTWFIHSLLVFEPPFIRDNRSFALLRSRFWRNVLAALGGRFLRRQGRTRLVVSA